MGDLSERCRPDSARSDRTARRRAQGPRASESRASGPVAPAVCGVATRNPLPGHRSALGRKRGLRLRPDARAQAFMSLRRPARSVRIGPCWIAPSTLRPLYVCAGPRAGAVITAPAGLSVGRSIPVEDFVDVLGAVEPRALAGAIAAEAHRRAAEALVIAANYLEDDGRGLNELQKIELVASGSRCLDGFEAAVLAELADAFKRIRVRHPGWWARLEGEDFDLERTGRRGSRRPQPGADTPIPMREFDPAH